MALGLSNLTCVGSTYTLADAAWFHAEDQVHQRLSRWQFFGSAALFGDGKDVDVLALTDGPGRSFSDLGWTAATGYPGEHFRSWRKGCVNLIACSSEPMYVAKLAGFKACEILVAAHVLEPANKLGRVLIHEACGRALGL